MMENEPANILLIEDNPGDADLVRLRLVESKSEVHVNCVPRLSDALECLDAETPSLVLLDLNLPDSHGAETFRRILVKAPNVPVVILSGQDDQALVWASPPPSRRCWRGREAGGTTHWRLPDTFRPGSKRYAPHLRVHRQRRGRSEEHTSELQS